ncbi:MAG TPA: LysR family transcriptional regulator [Gammaproteobacteria bacterium]|nr:LysR family transcriptional regulator [Gammaproteobacteria bacterium]
MNIFVEVARRGGFTPAARHLALSRAQVSKAVSRLEQHLGVRLLNRTTRRVSLTATGRVYLERCETILEDIAELEDTAARESGEPAGRLQLSAPTSFGILHLKRAIPAYLEKYPAVQISLSLTDRFVDIVAEGFDLAIRIAELEDSSLVARRIAPSRLVCCAAPDYLEKHGEPRVPQDLAIHHCLVYSNDLQPDRWQMRGPAGIESVRVNGPVCADNGDVLRSAALSGLGIALLPTFIVGADIRKGSLRQVLADYYPPPISINAVFPSRRFLSVRVRSFVEFLVEFFGETPDWN